jgi:serine/threonine protein kinase
LATDRLAAYGSGRLPLEEAAALEAHLADCERCRTELDALPDDSLVDLLRANGSPPGNTPHPDDRLPPAVPPALVDHPRYRLIKYLGQGGMGQVWLAEHRLLHRTVALKVIRRRLTANRAAVERFKREMQLVAKMDHPNVVRAFDAEQAGDTHLLVMEYVDGTSLARMVEAAGRLPVRSACEYVRQVGLSLQHAHERGLVHRDIKPGNILVDRSGTVKVLDFGLGAFVQAEDTDSALTEIGQAMGTPDYISPEQARNSRSVDIRADIYSLGCTLYCLLSGSPPFSSGNAHERIAAHLERQPQSLDQLRPDLSPGLVRIVGRMLAKEPADRYQSPAEVTEVLSPFCMANSGVAGQRRRWLTPALLLTVALSAVIAGLALKGKPEPQRDRANGQLSQANPVEAPPPDEAKSGDLRKHLRIAYLYDEYFKGMQLALDDERDGRELVLTFPNQTVARGPLRPLRIGDEWISSDGKVLFELSPKGDGIRFLRRNDRDVRVYKHCGYIQGVRPGRLTFAVEVIGADGQSQSISEPIEVVVPAFRAGVIRPLPSVYLGGNKPLLRVWPFWFMKSCFIASRESGPFIPVNRDEAVPTTFQIPLGKAPGYDGTAGSQTFWLKGITESGQPVEPEEVTVLVPEIDRQAK